MTTARPQACTPLSTGSRGELPPAARTAGPPTWNGSRPPRRAARPAVAWAAPTSPTASPRAARTRRPCTARAAPTSAIVSAYNDMLSAHQPFERYPAILKKAALRAGGVAQFAGGVPAMCDGITQGRAGMELSLFSRDVIAMATAVALSHDMFDAALMLGVCDKIVPGLLIGALAFGHLPTVFVPAGPMPSGLPNAEKSRGPPAARRGPGRPRRAARGRGRRPTTRPAPAPSTAPRTPTSCSSR